MFPEDTSKKSIEDTSVDSLQDESAPDDRTSVAPQTEAQGVAQIHGAPIHPGSFRNWRGRFPESHHQTNSSSFTSPSHHSSQPWNSAPISSPLSASHSAPGYLGNTGFPQSQVIFNRVLVERPYHNESTPFHPTPLTQQNSHPHETKRPRLSPLHQPPPSLKQEHPDVIKAKPKRITKRHGRNGSWMCDPCRDDKRNGSVLCRGMPCQKCQRPGKERKCTGPLPPRRHRDRKEAVDSLKRMQSLGTFPQIFTYRAPTSLHDLLSGTVTPSVENGDAGSDKGEAETHTPGEIPSLSEIGQRPTENLPPPMDENEPELTDETMQRVRNILNRYPAAHHPVLLDRLELAADEWHQQLLTEMNQRTDENLSESRSRERTMTPFSQRSNSNINYLLDADFKKYNEDADEYSMPGMSWEEYLRREDHESSDDS